MMMMMMMMMNTSCTAQVLDGRYDFVKEALLIVVCRAALVDCRNHMVEDANDDEDPDLMMMMMMMMIMMMIEE
jgi:hypothetical protein